MIGDIPSIDIRGLLCPFIVPIYFLIILGCIIFLGLFLRFMNPKSNEIKLSHGRATAAIFFIVMFILLLIIVLFLTDYNMACMKLM